MKKLIPLLLLSHFAFSQTAQLDANSIFIGEQTNFTIANELSNTSIWPTYEEFLVEGVEIIRISELDNTENIISQTFTITVWDSGSYYIPAIEFSENNKTEGLLLNVQTVILEEGAELKDIKQPIEEPIGWSDIWPWLLGIVLLALVIYLLTKYVFNTKPKIKKVIPKVIIPADVTALRELTELDKQQLWQSGKIKDYQSELSEIIRRYTENRFNFIALELATDEILKELKIRLNAEQLANIRTLLQRADLAKFAKSKPNNSENEESMTLAKQFVNNTKAKKGNE
jgi:low affinity Fe/Cu permease